MICILEELIYKLVMFLALWRNTSAAEEENNGFKMALKPVSQENTDLTFLFHFTKASILFFWQIILLFGKADIFSSAWKITGSKLDNLIFFWGVRTLWGFHCNSWVWEVKRHFHLSCVDGLASFKRNCGNRFSSSTQTKQLHWRKCKENEREKNL